MLAKGLIQGRKVPQIAALVTLSVTEDKAI
jgi:hypothetical protein